MKKTPIIRRFCLLGALSLGAAVTAGPALGQGGVLDPAAMQQQQREAQFQAASAAPQPNIDKNYPAWVGFVVMVLMAVGIIPLSLLPSKRSHQD